MQERRSRDVNKVNVVPRQHPLDAFNLRNPKPLCRPLRRIPMSPRHSDKLHSWNSNVLLNGEHAEAAKAYNTKPMFRLRHKIYATHEK